MNASFSARENDRSQGEMRRPTELRSPRSRWVPSALVDHFIDSVESCPWGALSGRSDNIQRPQDEKAPLYTPEERRRRDASPWTIVQGILAPLQFLAFAVSLVLVMRYLLTGRGYEIATASILVKTIALYAIMITGSIWEKEVFGKWLFARAFFWEDAFSMIVIGLQTAYLAALLAGWGTARQQMMIAVAAYATYVINAAQFLVKLRAARLEGQSPQLGSPGPMGRAA